jgi:hypothetical protein
MIEQVGDRVDAVFGIMRVQSDRRPHSVELLGDVDRGK